VELYVNNVIVDYKTADASGLYTFNVPLVYGSTEVMLKFYGPYGEERIQRQYLNIPFNFLPKGELEYNVSYGTVLDKHRSRFAKAEAQYGVTRYLTVGRVEYLSSITTGKEMPFLKPR
jgi:outer membrane usher protein FimD/PapC